MKGAIATAVLGTIASYATSSLLNKLSDRRRDEEEEEDDEEVTPRKKK